MNCQKHLFSLDNDVHYLNCAYMSPLLKSVEEKGLEGMIAKRNPFTVQPTDFFSHCDELRMEFAKLIGTDEPNRIALISSTSYGLSNVAGNINFQDGDEIIVLEGQFPSNYYIWEKCAKDYNLTLTTIESPNEFPKGKIWNERILEAITSRTKVVAMPHVHWADGTKFDLKSIREKSFECESLLVIDGTQSVGALPFYIDEFKPDALICSGYKWLMGPYSVGLAYMGPYFDEGRPIEENWISRKNSEDFAGLVNYEEDYQPGALRYDVGERSNFILVPMLLEAVKQINQWGTENIIAYCNDLVNPVLNRLSEQGYMIENSNYRSSHLFGLRKSNFDPKLFSQKLSDNNIYVSVRGDAVRVSVNVFNDQKDLESLEKVCMDMAN